MVLATVLRSSPARSINEETAGSMTSPVDHQIRALWQFGEGRPGRCYRRALFLLQKRRAKRRFEGPVVIGDLHAFADVAAGNDESVVEVGVRIFRVIHEGIVVHR